MNPPVFHGAPQTQQIQTNQLPPQGRAENLVDAETAPTEHTSLPPTSSAQTAATESRTESKSSGKKRKKEKKEKKAKKEKKKKKRKKEKEDSAPQKRELKDVPFSLFISNFILSPQSLTNKKGPEEPRNLRSRSVRSHPAEAPLISGSGRTTHQ